MGLGGMGLGTVIYWFAVAYLSLGAVTAAAFLAFGLDRIDPAARGAYAFRPLLVPGLVLLWPLVLALWRSRARAASEA